ncbi:hypothetical protein D1646_17700 [Pseudoflavonifractor sp. 60]|uniref:hypothetical protein n=1 Tax=Pseudoflavonifractor sp. 60 TaxID=2304576 RepID=UPI00136D4348|nr:hypothetical protein [Pseudoflavonifractor sp. 60]NBI68579.1 hypothetical protein [Pseudoflavonifractor sp. 60]
MTRSWAIKPAGGRLLAGLLSLTLALTGCSALLERDYTSVTPHNAAPATEGNPSTLRADSYQELVNALVYFISGGMEEGTVRLYTRAEDVESFLSGACLEVVQEDPLGAYCVEFIKYTVDPVVTYFQADVHITYRRSREQVASIVQATGVTAIRSELESALSTFATERVLRISYFEEDEAFIRDLARQAYYNTPASALGMPEISVFIYPNTGRQRIVEILMQYPLERPELESRQEDLAYALEQLAWDLDSLTGRRQALAAAWALLDTGDPDPLGGSTAYDLFHSGSANSEGLSLAYAALCQQLELSCQTAQGEQNGEPHFWNVVQTAEGWRHIDLSGGEPALYTDAQLLELGYTWGEGALPACAEE